ncbi:unnamed protein product [Chilo suppressalis]|uniref:Major facilitator superfamily (MFS) profile domain-containing protein n=1 Tax=Chilo suppressalis TaxID=168631 RepID=A0ABN8EBP2_CHISP|nr:unnamed protein product [Chilo suppressalis]
MASDENELRNRDGGNNINEDESALRQEEIPLNPDAEDKEEPKRTCGQKCIFFFKSITLEPTISLYIIAYIISAMTISNLSIEKACRVNLNFPDEICTAMRQQTLESQNTYERDVQRLVTTAVAWKTYLTATIPCVIALFVGPWQDNTGHRKIFLIIPIIGQLLACVNNILNVYFFHKLNLEVLVFTDAVIEALTGGMCVMVLTVFAFISAISSVKTRTFRMGMVNFSFTVSFPVAAASSGVILKNWGYYATFGISFGIHIINLLYNIFVLKDPPRTSDQKQHDRKGAGHFFRTFFDLSNIKETVIVVFKKGPNRRRLRMIVLLLVVTILFGPMFGEISILYMSTRYRFNWDELQFSMFQTYNFVIHTIGTIFSIAVLSKYLQWHDSMLGIISTISKIAASFVYCFAPNERIFYIAPAIEILNGTSLLALRSITSKLVAPNELGKVNSIFSLTENLMPLVYVPLYTKVYSATMEVLPGAVFLLGAAMTLPAVVVFLCLFVEHRKGLKKKPEKIENGL